MFPYLIAGAIGYAVAKIFESDESPKYADGGDIINEYDENIIKPLLLKSFDYLSNNLEFIGSGINGCAFITEIDYELYVVKYTKSITEFWLTEMAFVSNPPNIVTIKDVKKLSDNYEYGIIHKWTDRDSIPNKAVWNVSVGIKTKEYLDKLNDVPLKEREYVKNLAIKFKDKIENYFGGFSIDISSDNIGYEDGKLVLFDIDGNVKKNQYQEWMKTHSKKYTDGGDVLLAPNGKPSNLTPEQYELVRTPAFKKWFGDWQNDPENASKVVDENGEPLVCYHTTDYLGDINIFKFSEEYNFLQYGYGVYFTDDKKHSEDYFDGENYKIYEVFLNLKNPIIRNEKEKGNAKKYFLINREENNKAGAIIYHPDRRKWNYFIAGEPNQIKLADGTNTTFDGNNPDIRYAGGGNVIDKSEILKAISENKKININGLIFSSFLNNSTKKMEYWMQSDYKPDKWKDYPNEIEYTKAIMQRVNYFLRKGNTNSIQILH